MKTEDAVSPVVGVMLMLVITIIIAGVIAVFAGGILTDTEKIPTALISGSYSQSSGLTLTNIGGDVLDMDAISVLVSPSTGFTEGYRTLSWQVSCLEPADGGGIKPIRALVIDAGQTKTVNSDPKGIQVKPGYTADGTTDANYEGGQSSYGFNHANAVGKYITVILTKNGKECARTEVRIER